MTSKLTREELRKRAKENINNLRFASKQRAFESARKEILADLQLAEYALEAMESEPYGFTEGERFGMVLEPRQWPAPKDGEPQLHIKEQPGPDIDTLRHAFETEEREETGGFNLHKSGIDYVDKSTQAQWEAWLVCRAAMLQGKAEPVSLHPELSVWYGSMPESNGKSNWTAILHRKGECLSTGITIELSEYPERVRYEADRVRHIIGELKEEPDILAYDADAHSGYVKPGNSPVTPDGKSATAPTGIPVIPDGYVMVPKEPTQAMCAAFNDSDYGRKSLRERYVAMLAAAQQPQDEPQNIPEIIPGWIPVSERMPDDDDFVYIWPRPDFGVELHVGQYCECSPKGDSWYAQVYEQNYGIEWYPITVTHWMPLPAAPQEVQGE
ncbi:DUF551 domain-containing protein [Raoultella planticola]